MNDLKMIYIYIYMNLVSNRPRLVQTGRLDGTLDLGGRTD